jgi:hypothetical protein
MDETHATLSSTTTSLLQGKDVLNMHDELLLRLRRHVGDAAHE